MEDLRKRLLKAEERLSYLIQIKDGSDWGNLSGLQEKFETLKKSYYDFSGEALA